MKKMKKALSMVLVLAMVLSSSAISAFACTTSPSKVVRKPVYTCTPVYSCKQEDSKKKEEAKKPSPKEEAKKPSPKEEESKSQPQPSTNTVNVQYAGGEAADGSDTLTVTVTNPVASKTYVVQVKPEGSDTWTDLTTPVKYDKKMKDKGQGVSFDLTGLLDSDSDVSIRVARADDDKKLHDSKAIKEGKVIYSETQTLEQLAETVPSLSKDLKLKLTSDTSGQDCILNVKPNQDGDYTYTWEYLDDNGEWQLLTEETGPSVNAGECEALLDGGRKVRVTTVDAEGKPVDSNELFVNLLRDLYDQAIEEINEGLGLADSTVYYRRRNSDPVGINVDLSIGGQRFTDYFYYGNIAQDLPVSNSAEYADYLAKIYLDAGGNEAGLDAVAKVWDRYLYDIYDPSYDAGQLKNIEKAYPNYTYGDMANHIKWPKDECSSFNTPADLIPGLKSLDYNYLEKGVDYSDAISEDGIRKQVTAVEAGDTNITRQYDVDLSSTVAASMKAPVAMILQIQTSWQMFDLDHANCVKNDGTYETIEVGSAAYNTEIANLYAIKKALMMFADYMEDTYKGNNLVIGITETEHGKSSSLFYQGTTTTTTTKDDKKKAGKDKKGGAEVGAMYVTNDHDTIIRGLELWNSFGNCEHVHYDSETLEAAVQSLEANLGGWVDTEQYELDYDDVRKVAVIIGGCTENTTGTNGYGITLPWSTFQSAGLNSVYGIRTNIGTPVADNAQGCISWLEYSGNFGPGKTPYKDGAGSTYTQEYVATTTEAVFNTLVDIAETEMVQQIDGDDMTAKATFLENVTITDTITDEFELDTSAQIVASIYDKDQAVLSEKVIGLDDEDLSIVANADGTTTVSYNFGDVYNTTTADLKFKIVAKEDYIGSNNVLTNVGVPALTYNHTVLDENGQPTDRILDFAVDGTQTPEVNVPVRFEAADGGFTSVMVGTPVDLAELDTDKITENVYDSVVKFDQTNGTIDFTWLTPEAEIAVPASVHVTNGIPDTALPAAQELTQIFTPEDAGTYEAQLLVRFTPDVCTDNGNFADAVTAVPVNEQERTGKVSVEAYNAEETPAQLTKVIVENDAESKTSDAAFGDLISYKSTVTLPVFPTTAANPIPEENVSFVLTEQPFVGISYQEGAYVEGLAPDEYSVTYEQDGSVVVALTPEAVLAHQGEEIALMTQAVLTTEANVNTTYGNPAPITLTYAEDPRVSADQVVLEDSVTTFSYALVIRALDDVTGMPVPQAVYSITHNDKSLVAYKFDSSGNLVSSQPAGAPVLAYQDGVLAIYGIDSGAYSIGRRRYPSGYRTLHNNNVVTIDTVNQENELTGDAYISLTEPFYDDGFAIFDGEEDTRRIEDGSSDLVVNAYYHWIG